MTHVTNQPVLLAEDDRAVRESLVRALTLEGYAVRAVSNGALALEALRDEPADLLLLDVSMPVVDGITVCRVLRGEHNRLPILMLTARTETSDRVDAKLLSRPKSRPEQRAALSIELAIRLSRLIQHLVPGEHRCTESASGIAGCRLNPDIVKNAFA